MEDAIELVDMGCELDKRIKELSEKKQEVSDRLKILARETGTKKIQGSGHNVCTISTYSKSEVNVVDFISTCEELQVQQEVFIKGLRVAMTEAKSILGASLLGSISKVETDLYGRISYKYL